MMRGNNKNRSFYRSFYSISIIPSCLVSRDKRVYHSRHYFVLLEQVEASVAIIVATMMATILNHPSNPKDDEYSKHVDCESHC